MSREKRKQAIQSLREKEFAIHNKYRTLLLNEHDPEKRAYLYQQAYNELFTFFHESMPETRTFGWGAHLVPFFTPFLKNKKVLELGCAGGVSTFRIASVAQEVVGIDASSVNIEKARSTFPEEYRDKVSFECMDAAHIDFAPESFDVVYSNDLVEHLHPDDMDKHLRQCHRILRNNGYYICVTPHRDTGPHDATKYVRPKASPPEGLHLVEYDYRMIGALLKAHGFDRIITSGISPGLLVRLKAEKLFRYFMRPLRISEWLERSVLCRPRLLRSLLSLNLIHLVARKVKSG